MTERYDLRTVADGAADAWNTAAEWHKPLLRDCSDALVQAADEIDRLQAALQRITNIVGCECDDGYTCGLCKVRRIARDAAEKATEWLEAQKGT